jgi:hypothetical protein
MTSQHITDTASAVLQKKLATLRDPDRAKAVLAIHPAGASLRELAKALNGSPSLLSTLIPAAQAPLLDQIVPTPPSPAGHRLHA